VVAECAAMPRVLRGRFRRDLAPGDPVFPSGLYWKLDHQADDEAVWTIDMWLLERGAGGGLDTTTRLGLLTDDRRAVVLGYQGGRGRPGSTLMTTLPTFWPASTYPYASTIRSSG
jgi:hypothetical protein